MSSNSQCIVSVTTTTSSKNDDNCLTQKQLHDTLHDNHSRNAGHDTIDFVHQQKQRLLLDGAVTIDQSNFSKASTTATTTNEIATYHQDHPQQVPQHQLQPPPQHVVHYPAEFIQLGKRKFQNFESNQFIDESQPSLQNFTFSNASHNNTSNSNSNNTHNNLDNEAGLSLLFAASILQQQQQNHHQDNNNIVDKTRASGSNIPISTMATVNWGPPLPHINGSFPQFHTTTALNTEESKSFEPMVSNDEQAMCPTDDSNSIEPRANDVLCGRGGGINKHYGNIIYRRVVEYNKRVYKQVPKRHRMLVSRSIVQAIINAGGRFLQQQEEVENVPSDSTITNHSSVGFHVGDPKPTKQFRWTPIPIRRAVQKTSQALRERSCSYNNNEEDDNEEDPESLSS